MNTKNWESEFVEVWNNLHSGHRLAKAKHVVEQGIKLGHGPTAIAKTLNTSEWPLSKSGVQALIDLYGVVQGLGSPRVGHPSTHAIAEAKRSYADKIEIDDKALLAFIEKTGADRDVAERLFEAIALGELIKEDGGEIERETKKDRAKRRAKADDTNKWNKSFESYWEKVNEFLSFLKATEQDGMGDPAIPSRLKHMSADFEVQADRFEIGVAKFKAREKARVS